MISKEKYLKEFEFQLNEWSLRLDNLQILYDTAENSEKNRINGEIDAVWNNFHTVRSTYDEICRSNDANWMAFIDRANDRWHTLKLSYLSTLLLFK
jgi:hypothetical protein